MKFLTRILCATALVWPSAGSTHPHLFVQAELTVLFEDDVPVGVQVDWIYDEFFSLLLTSDLGIDLDGDMVLTADEQAVLAAAVTKWPDGFEGDLEVRQHGEVVPLGAKVAHTMSFDAGIVRESHVRVLADMDQSNFTVQAFDPYYYIAYDLLPPIRVSGRDNCRFEITPADLDAARALAADLLGGLAPEDVGPDEPFPEIGTHFADVVTISCA